LENNPKEAASQTSFSPVDDFNLGLFVYIVNKTVIWLVLIVILSITLSLVYLRYAPRIYQSATTLMLKSEKTTEVLGVQKIIQEQDDAEISREIRLLKSKLLLDRVINALPLQIGYYKEGKTKFIFSELYTSSPFEVEGQIKNENIYNVPIYVKMVNSRKVYVGFEMEGKEYEINKDTGDVISNQFFNISIHIKGRLSNDDYSGIYYFKFLNRGDLLNDITEKLEVLPIDPRTKTIGLVYKDRNPMRAKEIIETVAEEFVKYDVERKREGISNILAFIESQIDTFGTAFDRYQDSVSNMKLIEGYLDKGGNYASQLSQKTMEYEENFRDFKYDISLMQTFKSLVLANKDYANLPSLQFKIANVSFDNEINSINQLQQQRNIMMLEATAMHPAVRLIDKQIEESKIRLNKSLDNAISTLMASFDLMREEYKKYMAEIMKIPDLQSKFERLDKMADIRNDFVLNLYSQKSDYLIASAGIVSDYVILQKATLPGSPISPKEIIVKIAGVVIGLLLGLIMIVIRYLLHNTIISIDDVARKTKATMLGVIPSYKDELERSQIVVTQDPKSTITEAFRGVRANLQFINSSPGPKILSTTSTIPGEGKTFVSLNIAAILSLLNKRVIILDFDMRKPRLNKIFEVDSYKGVSTILSGQSNIDDCILESGVPRLDFITSGPVPPNPSELILLPKLDEMLEYLKTKYDYIVIDTPPIGLVTDALEILKISDYPVYIFRAAYSNRGFVQNVNRIINESKINNLSIVINDFGRGASGYGYYYGYGYGYDYGYGYGYGYGYYGSKYGEGYYTTDEKKKEPFLKRLLKKK